MSEDAEILRDLFVFNVLLGCILFLYGVFCGSPLCWRVEPLLQFRMSRITLMKCCKLLYLTDSNCVVADAVMYSDRNHKSLTCF